MYICICNSVTDRQIRQAVEQGVDSLDRLRESLGVAACCGKCEPSARALLLEIEHESRWDPDLVPLGIC